MQCYSCKHDFCWMCLGDWKTHGSEYYECSRYKDNPNIANESAHAQAREALKKYLHYYERVRYVKRKQTANLFFHEFFSL
jgi:ariadne-2